MADASRDVLDYALTAEAPLDFILINTEDTISRLLTLIREAKDRVILVSPYVTLGGTDRVGHAIRESLRRGVKVQIVVRDDEQTNPKAQWLTSVAPLVEEGLRLFGVPALHSKVYRSETTALITSLNLLESSFLNTIEVGLWSQDRAAVASVDDFISKYIRPAAQPFDLGRRQARRAPAERAPRAGEGHCIRCGDGIPFDPRRPYCRHDFEEWAEWENEDYEDTYCHRCGRDHAATMRRPLCATCFRETQ
jgi:phosphatidylserine/phosphatidylglycerophosphate/cardiolipin synthase-like enzyme